MSKKLYRSTYDAKIAGVCGGIAEYFGIDSTIIRVVWAISALFAAGILAYIICAIIMPRNPDDRNYYDDNNQQGY